jgi:hypothetical protein
VVKTKWDGMDEVEEEEKTTKKALSNAFNVKLEFKTVGCQITDLGKTYLQK